MNTNLKIFAAFASSFCLTSVTAAPPPTVPDATRSSTQSTVLIADKASPSAAAPVKVQPNRNGSVQLVSLKNWRYERPPQSNLGKQVPAPYAPIVYPTGKDLRQETVQDIQDIQFSNGEVRDLKTIYIENEKNRASPYPQIGKPITRTLPLDLAPGKQPPSLHLAQGMQSSIVFSDGRGNPWYIENVSLNRTLFSDGRGEQGAVTQGQTETNILTLEPLTPAPYSNVTVKLKGMNTPIILLLTAAHSTVDVRVDAKVPGLSPDAVVGGAVASMVNFPSSDTTLAYFLDGVPPQGSRQLKVQGFSAEAWSYNGNTYYKTTAEVQFPAYLAAARSTAGTAVFRFNGTPRSVTLLSGGRAVPTFLE